MTKTVGPDSPMIDAPQVSASPAAWTRLASLDDIRGPGPFALSAGDIDLVVVHTAGGPRAFQGRCPHQGALLGEGELDGDRLVCRNHRWQFDATSGKRVGGSECLIACPVEVRGGQLWANTAALQRAAAVVPENAVRRRVADLPGPTGLPLLGNFHQIELGRFHLVLEQWAATYGTSYTYRMGPRRVMVVSDPRLSEQILRARPETYRRLGNVEPVFAEMGVSGVFSAEGAAWRSQRRLAMEALSQRNLRGFYPTLESVTRRLRARWERKAAAGATLDLAEELKRFTVDVTTTLAFGHDANTIEQGDDVIQRRLGLVFPAFSRRLFALIPTWRWWRMPSDRRLDRALAALREWLGERIADARERLRADPSRAEHPANFLESMIASRDVEGRPFSDEVIFGNAMTMLLAGEDTTAYTLVWAVHHLCDAPHVVHRLRADVDAVVGGDCVAPDIETANRFVYAGAVANEAMRLRPVAPLLFFEANRDVVIGEVAVPTGGWIGVLTRVPAVAAEHFGHPNEFRPERWIDDDPSIGAHDPSAHIPFGSGPRICPGRTLALLEMKIVLAMLYGTFDVERVGDTRGVREHFAFTMAPRTVRVRLRPRAA
jgi:cytochrome P450/nitrite reductase/ring-hydroxylating ferredoxin subunit